MSDDYQRGYSDGAEDAARHFDSPALRTARLAGAVAAWIVVSSVGAVIVMLAYWTCALLFTSAISLGRGY